MKDVVSFETAKRLKEAGFPQPNRLRFGQAGYYEDGKVYCVDFELAFYTQLFAPTATDILKEFFDPEDDGPFLYWSGQDKCWVCDFDVYTFDHQNPAEACAAAWLSIHEKTTEQ